MDLILLVNRLLLAAVFFTSGLAKFADRDGSRQAMLDFGLPNLFAVPFSIILPIAEIILAISLLFVGSTWGGAIGATGLLLLFIVGITLNLARGRTPDCHCFGQIHSEPIGWPTLIRNFILLIMAGFIVWQGPDNVGVNIGNWLTNLNRLQLITLFFSVLGLVILTAEGWLLMHLLRQNGRLLLRIESLEEKLVPTNTNQHDPLASTLEKSWKKSSLTIGMPAPAFHLSDSKGKSVSIDSLRSADQPILLLFSDPKCGPCIALMPKVAEWQHKYSRLLTIAVISRGSSKDNHSIFSKHNISNILLQKDREVASAYLIPGTPSAVLVLPNGKIGSLVASGSIQIEELVANIISKSKIDTIQIPSQISA